MISMSSLWQEVHNRIPHISFEDNFFENTSGMRNDVIKSSKFDFSATLSNINAQFAPVNKGLNSASIRLSRLFLKYFGYAQMTSLKFSKFNCTAAVDNMYAQFAPVNRGLNSAYIISPFNNFSKLLPVCAIGVIKN